VGEQSARSRLSGGRGLAPRPLDPGQCAAGGRRV